MAIRNFWVEAEVDGKATPVAFGPRNADGGFTLTVKMRDNGDITRPIEIAGLVHIDGTLELTVHQNGQRIGQVKTRR